MISILAFAYALDEFYSECKGFRYVVQSNNPYTVSLQLIELLHHATEKGKVINYGKRYRMTVKIGKDSLRIIGGLLVKERMNV